MHRLSIAIVLFITACSLQNNTSTDAMDATGMDAPDQGQTEVQDVRQTNEVPVTDTSIDSRQDTAQVDAGHGPACPKNDPTFAMTKSGCVHGYVEQNIRVFKGIPYAAPPVGKLRWRVPQPVQPWQGIWDARRFSPTCIQFMNGLSYGMDKGTGSEDCLYLNIWTPEKTNGKPLPVLFFIHGGSDAFGSASEPIYNGRELAKKGAVVVTINYRLGLLGFMGDPALTAEDPNGSSGNYGMLDIIAALKWVQRNIAGFNGDPSKVTVFGESAGAINACLLLFSPLSKGLFHNVILESGSCLFIKDDQKAADNVGTRMEKALGCNNATDVAACLRSKSTDALVKAGDTIYKNELLGLYPHVDGYFLPEAPKQAIADGHAPVFPVIAGTNRDEATAFTWSWKIDTKDEFESMMAQYALFLGFDKDALMSHYPVTDYKDYRDAFNHFLTDFLFVCPTRKLLRAVNTSGGTAYQYAFNYEFPGSTLGVTHGAELFYVFGTYLRPTLPDVTNLSDAIMTYWEDFAASSDPNGQGLANWPKYDKTNEPYLILDKTITVGQSLRAPQCDFLDTGHAY